MPNRLKNSLLLLLWLPLFWGNAKATHITGAELTYECIGGDLYRVTLKLYRDCLNGQAGFDNPIELFVFHSGNGNVYQTYNVPKPPLTPEIVPENWGACTGQPYNLCVEEAVYSTVISLPGTPDGYDIAWARCCRNYAIDNLSNPECEGVTFLAHVPGTGLATCNSMPTFDLVPPLFLCAGDTFFFDHSATDIDGDSLVYEISNPYTGTNMMNMGAGNNSGVCGNAPPPTVTSAANPMGPGPYQNVSFAPGYSYSNPFGSGIISIDPSTGYLMAAPQNPGIYVLAISVKEYRNGQLLSENKRDFQFHVIACQPQGSPPVINHDLSGLNSSNDTVFAFAGEAFCYDFLVQDSLVPSTIVVNPISNTFGGNGGFPPPYATVTLSGSNPPVFGEVCWEPNCALVGQTVPMVLMARDTNDCPNYNIVFDTIFVTVIPSPGAPPVAWHDLSNNPTVNGDTIVVDVQENLCFDFVIQDTLGGGNLAASAQVLDLNGSPTGLSPTLNTVIVGDSLLGSLCWYSDCHAGETFMLVTQGTNTFNCPPGYETFDTVFVRVTMPANPPPVTQLGPGQNPLSGDTIIARVHENFCFELMVADTSTDYGDSIYFNYLVEDLQGNFGGETPTYSVFLNNDTLAGIFCWTPRCVNNENVYRFIITGIQLNDCQITNETQDTIYVRVIEPYKPPPLIDHDLGANSSDNFNVYLEDNASFCYDFVLSDTVTPTYLSYSAEVQLLSGQPYAGPAPQLTYNSVADTLVTGTICWEVPCDYADQSFRIVMTGVDTFDCKVSNTVFDTILVHHIENIPDPLTVCRSNVETGDLSATLEWVAASEPDIVAYVIYRKGPDEFSYTFLDSIPAGGATQWTDTQMNADAGSYCYQVTAIDRCGNESAPGNEACTVFLEGLTDGYATLLNWTEYREWPQGVADYELYRQFTETGQGPHLLMTFGPTSFNYEDEDITEPVICYRVRATEEGNGCGLESWSNEVCVVFPPTLYVPTGFTPNGDGLNDIFTDFGEFEASFHMVIYDRWGKLMFESYNKLAGWDGTLNGQAVPEGVYVYHIEIAGYDGQKKEVHGTVTLIR